MSSLSTLPKGDSAWLLRKSIQRIMQQVSVLETNIGSSTTGNSANTQVIFNDAGTLRGDAGLTYNKATDTLSTGSATITGDLTAARLNVTGSTIPTNGVYLASANNLTFAFNSTLGMSLNAGGLLVNNTTGFNTVANIKLKLGGRFLSGISGIGAYSFGTADAGGFVINDAGDGSTENRLLTLNSTGLNIGGGIDASLSVRRTLTGTASSVTNILRLDSNGSGNTTKITLTDGVTSDSYITHTGGSTANQLLGLGCQGVQQLVINASGNVGIGVTPSAWSGGGFVQLQNSRAFAFAGAFGDYISNGYYDGSWKYTTTAAVSRYRQDAGSHQWLTAPSGTAGNAITFTQAMTLDASGNLNLGVTSSLINTTRRLSVSGTVAAALQSTGAATVETINVWHTATSGNNIFVDFDTEAAVTSRGSISYNRAGGLVAYNTTSDYRAKDIIGPVSNSGLLIDSLKVYVGKMKGATIERPMLIAHEAQEVAPYAVTGTKDEVDADGNPKYQQMDASALVPLLIAEIQSLRARVQTLETR